MKSQDRRGDESEFGKKQEGDATGEGKQRKLDMSYHSGVQMVGGAQCVVDLKFLTHCF